MPPPGGGGAERVEAALECPWSELARHLPPGSWPFRATLLQGEPVGSVPSLPQDLKFPPSLWAGAAWCSVAAVTSWGGAPMIPSVYYITAAFGDVSAKPIQLDLMEHNLHAPIFRFRLFLLLLAIFQRQNWEDSLCHEDLVKLRSKLSV